MKSLACLSPEQCIIGQPHTDQIKNSKKIDDELRIDKQIFRTTHRLLLLGAGESGKSTIVKQMRILHINGFSEKEKKEKIIDIRQNIYYSISAMLKAMDTIEPQIKLENSNNVIAKNYILTQAQIDDSDYPQIFYDYVIDCWNDPGVQKCYERNNEYHIFDSAKYFLDRIQDIRQENYDPTEQDVLRCRVKTTSIFETKFEINKVRFHMFDVGGQRGERRKWIQCFNDVTAIIFVSASSSYNRMTQEDSTKNCLEESLQLFQQIWNNRYLKFISIILFLNKQDLLTEKICSGRYPLERYFPEFLSYSLPHNASYDSLEDLRVVKARYFIREEFMKITKSSENNRHLCYPHFTCAVDTNNIRRVFNDCKDIILHIQLSKNFQVL